MYEAHEHSDRKTHFHNHAIHKYTYLHCTWSEPKMVFYSFIYITWPRFARIQSRHTFCKISTTSVSILETSTVERKLTLDRENPIALIIQRYATAAWSELSTVIDAINRLQPEIFRRVSLGFFKPFSESIKYIRCVFKGLTKTIIF